MVNVKVRCDIKRDHFYEYAAMRQQVDRNMNSAKFIAVCFGLMTLITISVVPMLSALSGLICASISVCSMRKGINSTQYALSAAILVLIAMRAAWVMQ